MFLASSGEARPDDPACLADSFYRLLQKEVVEGNPFLNGDQMAKLRAHRPLIVDAGFCSPELVASIYMGRRRMAMEAILQEKDSLVFDAGCGYGSDALLFALSGARVLAVDRSRETIRIARKRKDYYSAHFGKVLNITFVVADLNGYTPRMSNLSLTWLSSVLAGIPNQGKFLREVHWATRKNGKVMITDYNLMHPPFLLKEWRRRKLAQHQSPEFACEANFWDMVRRRGRTGARYFPSQNNRVFDDVQFFTPHTLARLLREIGFRPLPPILMGFVPPLHLGRLSVLLEEGVAKIPGLRRLGRAYVMTGVK